MNTETLRKSYNRMKKEYQPTLTLLSKMGWTLNLDPVADCILIYPPVPNAVERGDTITFALGRPDDVGERWQLDSCDASGEFLELTMIAPADRLPNKAELMKASGWMHSQIAKYGL